MYLTGFGRFHVLLLIVCGWANMSDTLEILSVSFLLPRAKDDMGINSFQQGLLTSIIFMGKCLIQLSWWIFVSLCLQCAYIYTSIHRRTRRGGGGGGCSPPPRIFQVATFGQKQVIFGQKHLIFGQETSNIRAKPLDFHATAFFFLLLSFQMLATCIT